MRIDNFFAELKRRNVYKVAVAYIVAGWALAQGIAQVFPVFDVPNWVVRLIVLLIIIGFPIALFLAWAFELTPEGVKRTEDIDAATDTRAKSHAWIYIAVVGALFSIGLFFLGRFTVSQSPKSPAKSIAVLPFVDMSQGKDQEYFCDGISEEILDTLAKVEGLRVVARTSSFSFKGRSADVTEVATKLNVATVLEGSLRRNGNRIRVSAQLIARDGFHLWSETYDRELQDVFAMQDEITRAIVDALKIKLALAPTIPAAHDTEAHDFYLQGLYFANKSDETSLRKALGCFQRALDKDPSSARAWNGIAATWLWLADAYVKPLEAYPAVKAAALKAISLDERSADAHCYLGQALMVLDWNLASNDTELKRALEIDPNSSLANFTRGLLRASQGDYDNAIAHLRNAENSDPLSPAISNAVCTAYLRKGLIDEAIAAARRSQQVDPNYIYHDPVVGLVYRETGQYDQALAVYMKAEELTHSPSAGLAITYARMGRKEDSRRVVNHLLEKARTGYVEGNKIASIYVALGENDEAFRCLERAYVEHSSGLYDIAFDPDFAAIRSDPRCADLLHRINFQPAQMLAR
jgi:serine/threonine-protein kinase